MATAASAADSEDTIRCDIVIIGAGIAGLSAANHLLKSGVSDFKILEARGRTGGRVFSLDTGSNQLELGANWIHGVLGNPLFELAMANGLVDVTHVPRPHHVVAALEDGQQMPFALLQETYEAYTCFVRRCEEYFVCNFEPPENVTSVGQHVRLETELYLGPEPQGQMARALIGCLLNRETCITGCHSMDDVDLVQMGSFRELPGGNISLPQGFASLLAVLSRDLPPESTLLRRCVTRLCWGHAHSRRSEGSDQSEDSDGSDDTVTEVPLDHRPIVPCPIDPRPIDPCPIDPCPIDPCPIDPLDSDWPVAVECRDGTRVLANHAIVTLPLGVLKQAPPTLFHPPLPRRKQRALERLGFGTVDKILLEFARPALPSGVSEVLLLWGPQNDTDLPLRETWYRKIYSFCRLTDTLLQGWVSGKEAEFMETLPSTEVAERCTQILRSFLNDPSLPAPSNCVCSSWASQEFSRGSYTAMAVGADQGDIDALAEPLTAHSPSGRQGLVMFAGEHTHRSFYSTAHGAYLSGRTAASQLLDSVALATADSPALRCDQLDLSSWIQGIAL